MQPAVPAAPAGKPGPLASKRAFALALRVVFALCGMGLLVGFFLPWFTVGDLMSVSGLGLVFSDGQMVHMLSGANRFLLFAIPALAVILVVGAVFGNRVVSWTAVGGGLLILGYGVYTLVRLFLSSTGPGMWLVIFSSVLALALGLVDIGRRSSAK